MTEAQNQTKLPKVDKRRLKWQNIAFPDREAWGEALSFVVRNLMAKDTATRIISQLEVNGSWDDDGSMVLKILIREPKGED